MSSGLLKSGGHNMKDKYLITGGAGFIGTNLADHYLRNGKRVTIFDDFSRAGTVDNVSWLKKRYRNQLRVVKGDVRQPGSPLLELVARSEVVFHLAAQVAVTTSVTNPRKDFETNALGTFNILEAARVSSSNPIVVYSSTNKVYGKKADLEVIEARGRYAYAQGVKGIPETCPLDFYSPYGCSKGAGDQYMVDYSRIYGLKTIVFRQSCIYGPHQFGIEDQGWVAWFAIRAMQNRPVTIYGDGKQVRDVLFIEDLISAYDAALKNIGNASGQAYNIGGGTRNILSLLDLIYLLEKHFGYRLKHSFEEWRPGDQLIYVSDIRKAKADLEWVPRVKPVEGIKKLLEWLKDNERVLPK
jgi:CDP-paratose 2-epimerase